jgi:hypothetical protein
MALLCSRSRSHSMAVVISELRRIVSSNPFLSAITLYANSLSGSGRG